jgi:hypothetical protein
MAELALDVLTTEGIPLRAFSTDMTDAVSPKGKTVTTRYAGNPTVKDFSNSANRVGEDQTLTPLSVTLDQYRGTDCKFTDLDVTYSDVELINEFLAPAIGVLVDDVIGAALAVATTANGYNPDITVAAADFDADDVADLAQTLTTAKVPKSPRSLILKPTYFGNLAKDNQITAASDGPAGTDPLKEHRIPRLHGFNVFEYNGTIGAASRNMEGIALHPQAILVAARQITPPKEGTWAGNVRSITDPNSGLTIQMREFYDNVAMRYEFSVLYGVAAGMPTKSVVIQSA